MVVMVKTGVEKLGATDWAGRRAGAAANEPGVDRLRGSGPAGTRPKGGRDRAEERGQGSQQVAADLPNRQGERGPGRAQEGSRHDCRGCFVNGSCATGVHSNLAAPSLLQTESLRHDLELMIQGHKRDVDRKDAILQVRGRTDRRPTPNPEPPRTTRPTPPLLPLGTCR